MNLKEKIESRDARIGVLGLGYVGLPLLIEYVDEGFECIGFDIDIKKVDSLNAKKSYIRRIGSDKIAQMTREY